MRTLPQHLISRRMFNNGLALPSLSPFPQRRGEEGVGAMTAWISRHEYSNGTEPNWARRSKRAPLYHRVDTHYILPFLPRVNAHCPRSAFPSRRRGRIGVNGFTGSVPGVYDGGDEILCKCCQNNGIAIEDFRPWCQFFDSQIYTLATSPFLRISLQDYGRGPGCASSLNVSSLPLTARKCRL
jgi:hypothetical protein